MSCRNINDFDFFELRKKRRYEKDVNFFFFGVWGLHKNSDTH